MPPPKKTKLAQGTETRRRNRKSFVPSGREPRASPRLPPSAPATPPSRGSGEDRPEQLRTPLGPGPPQLQCPPRPPGALWLRLSGGGGGALGRGGRGSWRRRSRAGPGGPGGGAGRAGGRPGGGMAEPSGAETRPQIRVTVKTPKDKEEIVICDRASVKEVGRPALEGGGGREPCAEGVSAEMETSGTAWLRGRAPGRGGAHGDPGRARADGAGRGRPAWASPASVARVGTGLAALPRLGAWWGSLGKRDTWHAGARRVLGLRGECAAVTGGGSGHRGTVRPE